MAATRKPPDDPGGAKRETRGNTMEEVRRDDCPHCGEPIAFEVDSEETAGRRIVDCDVCCRPIEVRFRVRGGVVQAVSVVAI